MLLKLRSSCTTKDLNHLENILNGHELSFHLIQLSQCQYIMISNSFQKPEVSLEKLLGNWIDFAITPKDKRILTTKDFASQSLIQVKNTIFGGRCFPVIAGPCSVESKEQIFEIASIVKQHGARGLRAGAFKPRTSPYDFQGLGLTGLKYLKQAAEQYDLFVVSELMDTEYLDEFEDHVDLIQVGARNMQNFSLLKALGKINKPIMLKRGLHATYEEWLSAAEYLMAHGNDQIILCERGIRTFESFSRNTLDISAIPILKDLTHLPVIVDPSHAIGIRKYVPSLAYAALAAGADGLMVETHTNPDASISDAKQTISPESLIEMLEKLTEMSKIFQREL